MADPVVMLIDDDPELGLIVGMLSRRSGHSVVHQRDVPAAWAALNASRPDLILLDVNLPGQSGLDLLRRVRQTPEMASLPVALFCQPQLASDIAAGWKAGASYLLRKNLVTDAAAWRDRLQEILRHVHGQAPIRSLGFPAREGEPVSTSWGVALNRVLTSPGLSGLGIEVLAQVLCRAFATTCRVRPGTSWPVVPTGQIDIRRLAVRSPPKLVRRFFDSVHEQLWCLYGGEIATAFADELRTAFTDPAR